MSSSLSSEEIERVRSALEHAYNVNFTQVVSLVILSYDWILMFQNEVKFIWMAPWTTLKILYLLTRYLAFFDTAVSLVAQFLPGLSSESCTKLLKVNVGFVVFGVAIAEVLLTLRTWAICRNKVWIGLMLSTLFVAIWIPNFILASVFARSLRFELQDVLQTQGCLPTEGRNDVLIIIWSLLLVYNTGIFKINQSIRLITLNSEVNLGTMLIPAYDYYKYRRQYGRTSNLVQMVLRDGIMYYIYLFAVASANMVVLE